MIQMMDCAYKMVIQPSGGAQGCWQMTEHSSRLHKLWLGHLDHSESLLSLSRKWG